MTNQPSVSSRVSAVETTAASTKEASGKGTDISADTPVLLLTNLGIPKTPTTKDVRRYLRELLPDQRIIEMPRFMQKPILEGIILRVRPVQSAEKYRSVWLEEGPLLLHHMTQQTKLLTDRLSIKVVPVIRYGELAFRDVLGGLTAVGHRRVGILSAYPQHSAMTVASVNDAVCVWMQENRDHLQTRPLRSFSNDPHYTKALVGAIEGSWSQNGRPDPEGGDRVLLSHHSIPVSMYKAGDPYHSERLVTTEAVRERFGLSAQECVAASQSAFGPSEWLKPTTINTVKDLAKAGAGCVDAICPGFVSDCLEALEEIDQLNREAFLEAGGSELHYVPWGSDVDRAINALEVQARALLSDWAEQEMYEDEAAG